VILRDIRKRATLNHAGCIGNASLATGTAEAAHRIADMLQRSDPACGRGLALKADALRMLGDDPYRIPSG
jgi:hypothetical protein